VILVGNGPTATQHKLGRIIDDYDIVVRFNCWRTDGFEDRLGSRCDVWAVNLSPRDTEKFLPRQAGKRRPGQFLIFPGPETARKRIKQIDSLVKRCYPQVPREIVPQRYPKKLSSELGKRATTGLVALRYLLDHYDTVDVHGFDILAGKGCDASHYWGGGSNIHRAHVPSGEARVIRKLIDNGRVGVLVDNIEPRGVRNPCSGIELPKRLHFVWLGSSPPRWQQDFMAKFEKLHPEWEIELWTGMPDGADPATRAAYEGAEYLCQRADLLRYWALFEQGGIYVDGDMLAERSLNPLRFLGPVWAARQHDGRINNACMGALPGHPTMRLILDSAVDVYKKRVRQGFSFPAKRADYGPNLLTRLKADGAASGLLTVHKHYFYPLDKRASAHNYWKAPAARRKKHHKALRKRFVDGEAPFMVHLWGVKNSAKARTKGAGKPGAKFKTVKRRVSWSDREQWLWPAKDKELLRVFEQVADVDVIMKHVKQRRTCIQAGGACGIWPLRFSMFFDTVYTFEPSPDTFQCLNHNCDAVNVYRYQAGLFSRAGFSGMSNHRKDERNWGAKFIDVNKNGAIPLMRIDNFKFDQVDLIQLDIEGSELDALKGCKKTIERCRPVIVIEEKPLKHLEDFRQRVGDARRWLANRFDYRTVGTVGRDVILSPPDQP
jgi:FkbM family methyltransferase